MDSRLPAWLKDKWLEDLNALPLLPGNNPLECFSHVLEGLGRPLLVTPPTSFRPGGYYGVSWIWTWGLGLDDPNPGTSAFLQIIMDVTGRAEIWIKIGEISVVACCWESGHSLKYGYLTPSQIKQIWEAFAGPNGLDRQYLDEIMIGIRPIYYRGVDEYLKSAKL
jgi:hypothetical protein